MVERPGAGRTEVVVDEDDAVDLGLPDRRYFKIGEVASLLTVEPHVLRYWETQFSQIKPHKARSGHRLYRRRDVETLVVIKDLLHVQRFTVAGARQALRQQGTTSLLPRAAEQLTLPPTASLQTRHTRVVESTIPTIVEDEDDDSLDDDGGPAFGDLDDERTGDDVVEFHLADPLPRPDSDDGPVGEVELFIEARDDDELDAALEEQLAEQLASKLSSRSRPGMPARRSVVALELREGAPPTLKRSEAVAALKAAESELAGLLARLRKR